MGVEIDQTGTPVKKYRIGNQPEEYELVTKYLGWNPAETADWDTWCDMQVTGTLFPTSDKCKDSSDSTVILVSPDKKEQVVFHLHTAITKDAFPFKFFREEVSLHWHRFLIVSRKQNPEEKCIIPMH
jgi:hypothetical protein